MASQVSALPTNKILASTIAGAVVAIGVWAIKQWGKVDIPPEIAASATVLVSLVTAYLVPPADRDTVRPD